MTDSMISSMVAAAEAESQQEVAADAEAQSQPSKLLADTQAASELSSEPQDSVPPKAHAEAVSEPPTAAVESHLPVSEKKDSHVSSSNVTEVITVDSTSSSVMKGEVRVEVTTASESSVVEDIISGISSVKVEEPHVNGDSPVPMDTTPTQSVDLLGSLSDVHSVNHNGVDNTPPQTSQG